MAAEQKSRPKCGDRVRLYDGTEATVFDLQCSRCLAHHPHEDCLVLAHIGQRRWVNIDFLEVMQ